MHRLVKHTSSDVSLLADREVGGVGPPQTSRRFDLPTALQHEAGVPERPDDRRL
jgi:hypothetical protein